MSEKQEIIKQMLEMQKQFIAYEQQNGVDPGDYFNPAAGHELTADSVREALEGRLARYKIPRRIEFASELPREDSGKIFKRHLREAYWQGEQRRI